VPELKMQGVEAIVVLIHEGGLPTGGINECPGISGPIVDIVKKFDKAVDVVISGHTHRAYTCAIDGRLVTSGDKYGTLVTTIDLKLDRTTRDITSAVANNVIVHTSIPADPSQTALLAAYDRVAAPIAARPAGTITATLSRLPDMRTGESPLGSVIADAHLAATSAADRGNAVIAFTNPGGIRSDIVKRPDAGVSYGDVFAAQPFRNQLVTLTLTGAQIKAVLEQQWRDPNRPRILQVSKGFSYTWDNAGTDGQRVIADSMKIGTTTIDPIAAYRVTINNFLAVGGDGFTVLKDGRDPVIGVYDVDALSSFLRDNSPVAPATLNRIARVN